MGNKSCITCADTAAASHSVQSRGYIEVSSEKSPESHRGRFELPGAKSYPILGRHLALEK